LWVRARGKQVLRRDERGEIRAQARKSGNPVDLKLDAIPGVDVRPLPGPGMPIVEAGWYYQRFRDQLPEAVRRPADALVGRLYPKFVGQSNKLDDLSEAASVPLTSPVVYGLAPGHGAPNGSIRGRYPVVRPPRHRRPDT
jgi:hypothetical protein